jgi:hypothetical protein
MAVMGTDETAVPSDQIGVSSIYSWTVFLPFRSGLSLPTDPLDPDVSSLETLAMLSLLLETDPANTRMEPEDGGSLAHSVRCYNFSVNPPGRIFPSILFFIFRKKLLDYSFSLCKLFAVISVRYLTHVSLTLQPEHRGHDGRIAKIPASQKECGVLCFYDFSNHGHQLVYLYFSLGPEQQMA